MRLERHRSLERIRSVWDSLAPRDEVGLESSHLLAIERSGVNDIDPYYLLAFEADEPVGVAYCFALDMDFGFLEKELPPETLRTLRSWHPGFMKTRVLECGFVSGLGEAIAAREGHRAAVCAAAVREMESIARETEAEVLLVRDVPHARYGDYEALTGEGLRPLLGFPIARLALRWKSLDEYLQALKATSRYRVRRMLKHAADLRSEVLPSFGPHAGRLLQLWQQTHRRAKDYSHELLNEAYFREMDEGLGARSRAVVLKRGERIVAFSLALVGDREYFSSHAGLDYDEAGEDNLHFCLSMAVLEDALRSGARTLNRGITTYDVKFALGFEADPQVYLVKHVADERLTAPIAKRLREALPQPENTHRPFKDQDKAERLDLRALASEIGGQAKTPDVFDKAFHYEPANEARLAGLYGFFPPFTSAQGPIIQYQGRSVVMLGSNAYLGLGTHPEVSAAARGAVARYGTGCSGSPLLNGTLDIHVDLARSLAEFMQKDDAIVCSTGYQTNVGVVSALLGKDDVVIMDRLDHASLVDGARMAQAEVVRFRHNDVGSLEDALERYPDRGKLVVVDSVFSMEGTIADLSAIVRLAKKHGARVMVDEAHAVGVLGPGGRGGCELHGVLDQVDIVMGTFSKSFASIGGFVVGEARVIDYLRHAARSHMFSATLPPAAVAAARAALEIIKREPERRTRVLANAEYMARRLRELGYDAPYRGTAVVPVHCGRDVLSFGLYKKLLAEGVFVNPVAHPAVPKGRELLRTSYMATHTQEMLDRAAEVFARVRTESFPRRSSVAARAARQPALRVRPLVLLPVADRRSFGRYHVDASARQPVLRVPGFTRLDIGQPVDCGISFGKEGVIVQSQAVVVDKCLTARPGRPMGIGLELLPAEAHTWSLIARFVEGDAVLPVGRRSWRYHADLEVDCSGDDGERSALEDISEDGAAIRSRREIACGSLVRLRLKPPGRAPVEIAGEVRWRRPGKDAAFGVRFRFESLTERANVRELVGMIEHAFAEAETAPAAAMVH